MRLNNLIYLDEYRIKKDCPNVNIIFFGYDFKSLDEYEQIEELTTLTN